MAAHRGQETYRIPSDSIDVAPTMRNAPEAAMGLYRERGYHIEPHLLPDQQCDLLVATALANSDGSFKPIPMAHRQGQIFLDVMRYHPIVEIVEQLIGGRASGIGGEYFYMRPGTKGFTPHQDNFYVQAPPDAFVSAWAALCDIDFENGCLAFFPGSHRFGDLPIRSGSMLTDPGQNPGARAVESVLPDGATSVDVPLKKGSVVFFHGLLVHKSNDNISNRFRHSFLATYIRSGVPFRPGTYQKRSEIDLYGNA